MQESKAWARLPAQVASLLAVGASVATVTTTVADPDFTFSIFAVLLVVHVASFCGQLGSRWAQVGRLLVLIMAWGLVPLALFASPSLIMPFDISNESDVQRAVFFAWFAVAASYLGGSTIHGYYVPFSAALLPAMSTLGTTAALNINPEVTICFVVYAGAGLFLISYEYLLHRTGSDVRPLGGVRTVAVRHALLCGAIYAPILGLGLAVSGLMQAFTPTVLPVSVTQVRDRLYYLSPSDHYASFLNSFELRGGLYQFSDRIAMAVRSAEPFTFMRGRVYELYTGHGWRSEAYSVKQMLYPDNDRWITTGGRQLPPRHRLLTQEISPRAGPPSLMYGAGPIYRVSADVPYVRVDYSGVVYPAQPLPRYRSYTVQAAVFAGGEEELLNAPGERRENVDPRYLRLPPSAWDVVTLARSVAGNEPTPYRKVQAIARYLTSECMYSLDCSTVPFDEDAVAYFLFNSKQGACDMFASAMAVMLRAVDVPSRVVTGYIPSQDDMEEGWYLVRESGAHAWVEFYVPAFGWVPYDPTVGTATQEESLVANLTRTLLSVHSGVLAGRFALPAFVLMLAALLCSWRVGESLHAAFKRRRGRPRPDDHRGWLIATYHVLCERLRRLGFPRPLHLTPWEYLASLQGRDRMPPDAILPLSSVTDKFVEARYSPHPVTAQDVAAAKERVEGLPKRLKRK